MGTGRGQVQCWEFPLVTIRQHNRKVLKNMFIYIHIYANWELVTPPIPLVKGHVIFLGTH